MQQNCTGDHSGVLLHNYAMFSDLKSVQSGCGSAPDPDGGASSAPPYLLAALPEVNPAVVKSLHFRRTTYLEPPAGLSAD